MSVELSYENSRFFCSTPLSTPVAETNNVTEFASRAPSGLQAVLMS
jgi:hypothetical protein